MSPCQVFQLPDGTRGFICSRGRKPRPKCATCGAPADWLCDHPQGEGTCDAPMCRLHRSPHGPGVDYCPKHHRGGAR